VYGRHGSDPALLWLWCRPVATAPIRPLAWEPPYGTGAVLEKAKRQEKKERKREREREKGRKEGREEERKKERERKERRKERKLCFGRNGETTCMY